MQLFVRLMKLLERKRKAEKPLEMVRRISARRFITTRSLMMKLLFRVSLVVGQQMGKLWSLRRQRVSTGKIQTQRSNLKKMGQP